MNKLFERNQIGGGRGGKNSGNHMEAKVNIERKVKDLVIARTKREITHIILVIQIMETKEEGEDLYED